MADKKEEERKIPVFTVIKNGAILKNIFLVNNPPPSPFISIPSFENEETPDQGDQETLIVGRHPDCHIMLTHPSISRFHLQIQSNSSSQKLSVIDLSSVHGTWVSEKKIEPGIPVEMNEGDTLMIGGSTRVYRLHWVPLSQAYDMSNPFISPMDLKEVKDQELEERNEVDSQQDTLIQDKSIESQDLILDGIVSLFSNDNSESNLENKIPFSDIESVDLSLLVGSKTSVSELGEENQVPQHDSMTHVIFGSETTECSLRRSENMSRSLVNLFASPFEVREMKVLEESKNQCSLQKDDKPEGDSEVWSKSTVKDSSSSSPVLEVRSDIKMEHHNKENQTLQSLAVLQPLSEMGNEENSSVDQDSNLLANQNSTCFDKEKYGGAENQSLSRKGPGPKGIPSFDSDLLKAESVNSSLSFGEVISEITDIKKCQTPQSLFAPGVPSLENSESSPVRSDKRVNSNNIGSRRGKPASVLQIQTIMSRRKIKEEWNDADVELSKQYDVDNRSISQNLFSGLEETEEETFTPEKENLTPSLQRKSRLEEVKQSRSCQKSSSKIIFSPKIQPAAELYEEDENQSSSRKEPRPKGIPSFDSDLLEAESENSTLPYGGVLSEITDINKCQSSQSLFAPGVSSLENSECSPVRSDKRVSSNNIWSRRGKPANVLQIQTSRSRGKTKGDYLNADVELPKQYVIENRSISHTLFSCLEEKDEEIFTPGKENLTPNTLSVKSLQRKSKLEEVKQSRSWRKSSLNVIFSPKVQPEEGSTLTSNKENQTPEVLQQQKLMRGTDKKLELERVPLKAKAAERVPFQPLLVNSPGKRKSEASLSNATTRSGSSVKFTRTTDATKSSSAGQGRRSWTMVADTSTLLDRESRKSLQLLQGLKGTQLIIPRMVIRELDCLKRRGSLFRRTSEVSSLLEWIEECMVKTNWWIHIQSSVEEGRPVAPTPPASPLSQFSEGGGGFPFGTSWGTFSSRTSLTEIVSPSSEDHILDYTLLLRKMKNDIHLVLLSNDVTMKIKAMAEGMICETAQEFRESLVNPLSRRFLWADSSPRGRTWSYSDDVVLREKYGYGPFKKPSKGGGDGAKGLKLILLHNSHYAQIRSAR